MKLNPEQTKIYNEHRKKNPFKYLIPEPPRGNTIRLYNKTAMPPFELIGEPMDEWRSLAHVLDLSKNYWEKTNLSEEILYTNGLYLYLVHPDDNKFFKDTEYTYVGPALFEEDEYSPEVVSAARGRYQEVLDELTRRYTDNMALKLAQVTTEPPKPKKRMGRPKGSKNRKKVVK